MQIPRRKSEELRSRDTGPVYLTEEGFRRLKARLSHIERSLPELIGETARTASYGDRSDNAEYKEAKSALRRAHSQILTIQDQIKRVSIINTGVNSSGVVELGSTVVLEESGAHPTTSSQPPQSSGGRARLPSPGTLGQVGHHTRKTFQIVGPRETDPPKGRISHVSPLGAALMNRKKGGEVSVQTENGSRTYRILEIR
jgi:transcription elongation factor GreA